MRESGLGKSGCNKIVGYTLENSGRPRGAPQIPPLRYAPVGMTILFGNAKSRFQDELSSRPERTRISCHAALDKSAYAPFRKEGRMNCDSAIKSNRKSGGAEWRDLRCASRPSPILRPSAGFSRRL